MSGIRNVGARAGLSLGLSLLVSCTGSGVRPVEIYPEDLCSLCRMTVSDPRCAGEVITNDDEVYKFDDIGCMEEFLARTPEAGTSTVFVKDYETTQWVLRDSSTIVDTDLFTPMGSGKIAFRDPRKAREFAERYPETNRVR